MTKLRKCITTLASCFAAGAGLGAGCDRLATPVVPKPDPVTLPAEAWCDAACARWQAAGCKEGNDVCDAFNAEGACSRYVSCLESCEREPHAYPTSRCVADPPSTTSPFQTCEQIRSVCSE